MLGREREFVKEGLTVTAGLYGGLDIPNALHGDAVLVVPINELVFELTDLVEENAHLVRHVGYVFVAGLAPVGQLVLSTMSVYKAQAQRASYGIPLLPCAPWRTARGCA